MSKTHRPYEPEQMFPMPPSLVAWLPSDHLVFFVKEVLEAIDLSPITDVYEREERGYPTYNPKMMTGVLYCMGIAMGSPRRASLDGIARKTLRSECWQ